MNMGLNVALSSKKIFAYRKSYVENPQTISLGTNRHFQDEDDVTMEES